MFDPSDWTNFQHQFIALILGILVGSTMGYFLALKFIGDDIRTTETKDQQLEEQNVQLQQEIQDEQKRNSSTQDRKTTPLG